MAAHLPGCAGAETSLPLHHVWETPCSWERCREDLDALHHPTQKVATCLGWSEGSPEKALSYRSPGHTEISKPALLTSEIINMT